MLPVLKDILGPKRQTVARIDHYLIWSIVAIFIVIELIVLLDYSTLGDLAVEADYFAEIAPAAQRMIDGEIRINDFPYKGPVSAAAVALLSSATSILDLGLYRTGNLLSLVSAVITLWCVYRIGLLLWGRRTALAAAVLTGFNNVFFINSHKAGSDLLFLAIIMVALYLSLSGSSGRRRCILIGAAGGAAFLSRYIGIALPVWSVLSVLLLAPRNMDWRSRLVNFGWVTLSFICVVSPWLVFNLIETGALLTTRNLQNVVQEFYATGAPAEGFTSLWSLIRFDSTYFVSKFLANLVDQMRQDIGQVLGLAMSVLVAAGLVCTLAIQRNRAQIAFLGWGMMYALSLGFVFYLARFSLPLIPVYALLAASLLDRLPRWTPLIAIGVMSGVIAFQTTNIGVSIDFYRAEQPNHLQESIEFLKNRSVKWEHPQQARLMARKPHAAWYGQMEFVPYPKRLSGAAELLAYAADRKADFLIVGPLETRFFEHTDFLSRLENYRGVVLVSEAVGNAIYRLDWRQAGASFGTSENIDQLFGMWETSLRVDDAEMIKTVGTSLIGELDRDGRFEESRAIAMGRLETAEGAEALVVRLYVAMVSLKLNDSQAGLIVLEGQLSENCGRDLAVPTAKGYSILGQLYFESKDLAAAHNALQVAINMYEKLGMESEARAVKFIRDSLGN